MHVPVCETKEIDLLSFDTALEAYICNSHDFSKDEWIYVPPNYCDYRYILGTKGKRALICIGINPSTAVPGDLDNTLKSVERIAKSNGYDSFVMFNVYAQRATDPDAMDKCFNENLHSENMKAFEYILDSFENCAIWAAWGTIIEKRGYLAACVEDMIRIAHEHNVKWYTAGKPSKKGHPHHPLYLKKDSKLDVFDARKYLTESFT